MIIETKLYHNGLLFRDRIMVSELELLHLPPEKRPEVIQTAKRICAARCVQRWARQLKKDQKPNE